MEHIHFIGVGGTGLSAIATVLLEQGYTVSGSDLHDSPLFEAVRTSGGSVILGHQAENIRGADLVIRSSAIPDSNPEVQAALKAGIPVLKRSEFLARLTAGKEVLAVAGSHGKTTTSSMLAWTLSSLDLDPSFIVGGVVTNLGCNARAGKGRYFVVEADEYDYMFLGLHPNLALITNIEHDHPDIFPTPADFEEAFHRFVENLLPGGTLIVCGENRPARNLIAGLPADQQGLTYGLEGSGADYLAVNLKTTQGSGMEFEILIPNREVSGDLKVSLPVPGVHNVLNALGVFAAGDCLGLERGDLIAALESFQGSERRFDIRGVWGDVMIVDDYGHHPTEIRATLTAARAAYPQRYIRAVWQPHTYSRTETLKRGFQKAFADADQVIVLQVFEAREQKPDDFQIEDLVESIDHENVLYLPEIEDAADYLEEELQPGDLLLVFSAGDAIMINDRLEESLSARKS